MSCHWNYDCDRCGAPDCIATGVELTRHDALTQSDKKKDGRKKWREEHREQEREYARKYREKHGEALKAYHREKMREYRARQRAEMQEG